MIIYSTISLIYFLFEECPHFHASGGNFMREMIPNTELYSREDEWVRYVQVQLNGQNVIYEVTTQYYRAVDTEQDWIGDKEYDQMEWLREECLDLSGSVTYKIRQNEGKVM